MSKLEELIQELCPDGVEYHTVGSLIKKVTEKGKYHPDISQVYVVSNTLGIVPSEEFHDHQIHSEDTSNYTVIRKNMVAYNPSRLNIGSIGILKREQPGLVSPMYVVCDIAFERISCKYFEYILQSNAVKNKINALKEEGARFRFDFARWNLIQIPVPPLPVQEEIVRILDNFTALTAELTAELTARKKQYVAYCDYLLNPYMPDAKELNGVAEFTYGFTDKAANQGNARFIRITDISELGCLKTEDVKYITLTEQSNKYLVKPGDLLVARTGATFGKTLYIDSQNPAVYASFLIKITPKTNILNSRFYWHFSKSNFYWIQANKLVSGGGQPQFNSNALKRILVPLPPLEEQERIVDILDRFDTLCNDLTSGLPAEIEARQKQYEYYRDKLLSFKEAPAE